MMTNKNDLVQDCPTWDPPLVQRSPGIDQICFRVRNYND